jgi:hypothetical protein
MRGTPGDLGCLRARATGPRAALNRTLPDDRGEGGHDSGIDCTSYCTLLVCHSQPSIPSGARRRRPIDEAADARSSCLQGAGVCNGNGIIHYLI